MGVRSNKYELVPPDGGWGHFVNAGGILMVGFALAPISTFALIFAPFLSQSHDETSATTTVTSVFGTVFYITGLLANFLLQRLTYRKVALLGAFLYCTGSFASVFITNIQFVIITYGVLQGLGTGLILPSTLTAVNDYFERKKTLAIAIAQAIVALINMGYPGFTRVLLDRYGFRGTQAIFAAISLHIILGALTLQPIKWHMRKIPKTDQEVIVEAEECPNEGSAERCYERTYTPVSSEIESQQLLESNRTSQLQDENLSKSVTSLVSFGNTAAYGKDKKDKGMSFLRHVMDLSLLKDFSYWNIVVGLALCVTSEMNFMALLPIFLFNVGFSKSNVTLIMTIYFTTDLVMKLIISMITIFWSFRSREVFLGNIILTIIFRIVFTEVHTFWWIVIVTAILGFSRCLIQLTVPLVIAESYSDRFASAYSLSMVFTGIASLILGGLAGFVKHKTESDAMVLHVLTAVCLFCAIPWTIEFIYKYLRTRRKRLETLT